MKKHLTASPLYYWEEKSYMMAVLKDETENIIEECLERLTSSKEFAVKDPNYDIKGFIKATVIYDKEEYEIGFYLGGVSIPEYYLNRNFLFSDDEKEQLLNAKKAITIFMRFGSNPKKSYHLELKLARTLVPDLIGVVDESAERLLPEKWVKLAADSKILPSSKDLFNVQAVTGKKDQVWLHTHGLCRCNIPELEILESSKDHYGQHYNLITTYAIYLIDNNKPFENNSSAYIGRLINGTPVVVTNRPWTEGILEYKKLKLGGEKDRINSHNSKTNVIFLYQSAEDESNNILSKVSIYDSLWGENPIFFFSDEETNRMRDLARERFNYVVENFNKENLNILIKIGLPLKEQDSFEHIWFELLEIKGQKFKAKLTQEPYDVKDIHTGDEAWFTIKDVTDWIIYTKDAAISPSNVYLLEK